MTKCAYHSEVDAVTVCVNCGRLICPECKVVLGEKIYCNPCAEETLLAKAQVGEIKPNRVIPAEGESGQESLPEIPLTKG